VAQTYGTLCGQKIQKKSTTGTLMFATTQHATLSEYISQFIEKAKDPQSGLKQIEIPASLKAHSNELGFKFKTSFK
jgi:hypothetical protein